MSCGSVPKMPGSAPEASNCRMAFPRPSPPAHQTRLKVRTVVASQCYPADGLGSPSYFLRRPSF